MNWQESGSKPKLASGVPGHEEIAGIDFAKLRPCPPGEHPPILTNGRTFKTNEDCGDYRAGER
jgi:hypothetical protein